MIVKDASLGFKAAKLWRVSKLDTGEVRFTLALDNYTAAEAHGWRFNRCRVSEAQAGGEA